MKLIEIAAIGQNNELGKEGQMIWTLPEDLRFFQQKTLGHRILMGRKTLESLPKRLKDRPYIVLSKQMKTSQDQEVFSSVEQFLEAYKASDETIFVIGGGSVYAQLLPYSDGLFLTEIEAAEKSAEVFFPSFSKEEFDREVLSTQIDNGIKTRHVFYRRKGKSQR